MDRPKQTPDRRRPAAVVLTVKPNPMPGFVDVVASLNGGEGFVEDVRAQGIPPTGAVLRFDVSTEFDLVASERIRRMLAPCLN